MQVLISSKTSPGHVSFRMGLGQGPAAWELPCGSEATASSPSEVGPHTTYDERLVRASGWRALPLRATSVIARRCASPMAAVRRRLQRVPEPARGRPHGSVSRAALALFGCRALPGLRPHHARHMQSIVRDRYLVALSLEQREEGLVQHGRSLFKIRQLFSPAVISCRLKTKSPSKRQNRTPDA